MCCDRSAKTALTLNRPFQVGQNTWYITPSHDSSFVLKVRHGIIQEIGIAPRDLTHTRTQQHALLTSL